MRAIYTCLWWLLLPFIWPRLWWRARRQPEYLQHVGERFGRYTHVVDKPIIWIHAVSVGETRATQHLVTSLLAAYPNHQILLTHATPTGREASQQLFGDKVWRVYLPYDYPFAVRAFLQHFRPSLGVVMETEIWFNLIAACKQQDVPLFLLNARMSEKSARGYQRLSSLTKEALSSLHTIAAQTNEDAQRLIALGATDVHVMGNLKFDINPPAKMLLLGEKLRGLFGTERKVLLFASTRDGEEHILLEVLKLLPVENLVTVIVPRHPQRFDEVAQLIELHGLRYQCRSLNQQITTPVVLGDSMGEMFAYYASADVAFIGGSLLPLGGQNLIEACAVNTPVVLGPHMFNFSEATRLALKAGAARQIKNTTELAHELTRLLNSPDEREKMKQACSRFVNQNKGATKYALELLQTHLSK